jgi:hypothetical protein
MDNLRKTFGFGDIFWDDTRLQNILEDFERTVRTLQVLRSEGGLTMDTLAEKITELEDQLMQADFAGPVANQLRAMILDAQEQYAELFDTLKNDVLYRFRRAYLEMGRDFVADTEMIAGMTGEAWKALFLAMTGMTLETKREMVSILEDFAMSTGELVTGTVQVLLNGIERLEDALVKQMMEGRVRLKEIWKAIASDFMKLLIRKMTTGILDWVITFIPTILSFMTPATGMFGFLPGAGEGMITTVGDAGTGVPFIKTISGSGGGVGTLGTPGVQVVVHEATPLTWVEVTDQYIEPRMRERARTRTEEG